MGAEDLHRRVAELEERLAAAEDRERGLGEILASQEDLVCRWDSNGLLTYANEAYRKAVQARSATDLLGTPAFAWLRDSECEDVDATLGAWAKGPMESMSRGPLESTGGEPTVIQWRHQPIANAEGIASETVSVGRDVTQRVRDEQVLRDSEHHLRVVAENVNDFILMLDRKGAILYANRRLPGITSKDIADTAKHPWLAPSHADILHARLATALATGQLQVFEALGNDDEGKSVWYACRLNPLPEDSGFDGAILTVRDITSRKTTELSLRESAKRYRTLYENTPVMMCSADSDDRLLTVNEYCVKSLGYPRAQLIGRHIGDLMTHESRRLASSMVQPQLRKHGASRDFEVQLVRSDGQTLDARGTAVVYHNEENGSEYTLAFLIDVTELKAAERRERELGEKMLQTQKLESLGLLAGGIAHDFNNLLVGILGNASFIRAELEDHSPLRELVEEVETAALRASELAREMLAYSGKGAFVVQEIDLVELVREMGQLLRSSRSKKIRLHVDGPGRPCLAHGDATQFRQVIMNLMTNAADAIGEGEGDIQIRIRIRNLNAAARQVALIDGPPSPAGYVEVTVEDNGCGMPPDVVRKIFDPFFTTKITGRGLGLAAVMGIVRSHGGGITVDSTVRRGSVFHVYFPAVAPGQESVAEPEDVLAAFAVPAVSAACILVVDDEETVRTLAKRALKRAGYFVRCASDGREALEAMAYSPKEPVSAVLLDLTMPRMNGREAYTEIRILDPHIPVILTSGYGEVEDIEGLLEHPMTVFLKKPYRADDLVRMVNEVLTVPVK